LTFETAVEFTLKQEGVLSHDERDRGGLTKWGISSRYHPEVSNPTFSLNDATAIYRLHYWEPARCEHFPSYLRLPLFDAAVNPGLKPSIEFLQRAVGAHVDGLIGPQTIALSVVAPALETLKKLLTNRVVYYGTRDGFDTYAQGWIRRCFAVQAFVIESELIRG
jgi:lysozyme family protein